MTDNFFLQHNNYVMRYILAHERKPEPMTRKPLTNEQRIEIYTELSRRVQVGAYLELEHDGSFPPDDGTPESTTLESLHNLEAWAERQGLEFCWHHDDKTWSLEPIQPPEIAPEYEAMNRWLASQVEESEA